MNFEGIWTDYKYKEFLEYLNTLRDIKYKEFHSRIILSDNLIGIRSEVLKKIAKEISKNDYQSFIKINKSNLYDLVMIEGFLYGYLKVPMETLFDYLNNYLNKITCWSEVDQTVANLKIFKSKENQELGFKYAKKLIHSKKNWIRRFGIVMLLTYYLHDIYIDKTLEVVSKIKTDNYYVKMAIAWLISISYIKYKEKTLLYLVNLKDDFVYNKAINKIVDSKKVLKQEKDFIKSLKRKEEKNKKKEKIKVVS